MRKLLISVCRDVHLRAIRDILFIQAGYSVVPTKEPAQALHLVGQFNFAAAVVGHSFDASEKRSLIAAIKRQNPVPVISLYSGSPDPREGADVYVCGLDPPGELLSALDELTGVAPSSDQEACWRASG